MASMPVPTIPMLKRRKANGPAMGRNASAACPDVWISPTPAWCKVAAVAIMEIPATVKAIGRAGAGTNNIPVGEMSKRGVPVFNAPGANANAVKELVLAALLMAARNLIPALDYVAKLDAGAANLEKSVEDGKKQFAGVELPNRTLGIIGLGAIGSLVADTAIKLGMSSLLAGLPIDVPGSTVNRLCGSSMQVLVALARADGRIVTRDELIDWCWNGRIVGEDAINRAIFRLRQVAGGIGGGSFSIETITKVGYRLVARSTSNVARKSIPAPAVRANVSRRTMIGATVAAAGAAAAGLLWQKP